MKLNKLAITLFLTLIFICTDVMEINAQGVDLIKVHEGYSGTPYICPAGKLTIGYGHTGNVSGPITKEQAEKLLKKDLSTAENAIQEQVKVPLNSNQFSALVSFVYNVGTGNFARSTLRALLNDGNFEEAANEFEKWVYGGGKKLPGLIERRIAEKTLFLTPTTENA